MKRGGALFLAIAVGAVVLFSGQKCLAIGVPESFDDLPKPMQKIWDFGKSMGQKISGVFDRGEKIIEEQGGPRSKTLLGKAKIFYSERKASFFIEYKKEKEETVKDWKRVFSQKNDTWLAKGKKLFLYWQYK